MRRKPHCRKDLGIMKNDGIRELTDPRTLKGVEEMFRFCTAPRNTSTDLRSSCPQKTTTEVCRHLGMITNTTIENRGLDTRWVIPDLLPLSRMTRTGQRQSSADFNVSRPATYCILRASWHIWRQSRIEWIKKARRTMI